MQSITLPSEERKDLIKHMKRERRPSRRLRMHIVLLCADGRSPTEIARVLFCSRTTVYVVVARCLRDEQAAFNDRKMRGPKPSVGQPASEYIERLLEEDSPTEHGWLRSRWSCKLLAVELFKERAALVSRETVRRVLHRMGFRWRRPRPVPPEKDLEHQQEQKRRRLLDVLSMVKEEGSFFQDETRLETNPKVGLCWMRKGSQRRLKTPGTNHKVWISGALNFSTGRFHWVRGERKNDELFIKLLDQLRRTYRCHRELHLAVDNDASHTSRRVERYVDDSDGRIRLHSLPSWSPESNPVELVWWSLHEAVSRNHGCSGVMIWWSSLKVTSRSESPSGSNSARSTSGWRGRRHEIGDVHLSRGPI
jgi:transposase